jgi:DNA-binding NarL/FixJ family response regulator
VVRVALFSDDGLARDGLRARLDSQAIEVVAEGTLADARTAEPEAELLVVDIGTARDGSEVVVPPGTRWLALVSTPEQGRDALASGAAGTLRREATPERLAAAAHAAAEGLVVLEPGALDLDALRGTPSLDAPIESLTRRELEVLPLLADGLTNRRIAERLGISEHTVKFHVNAILGKLGAATRAEAVARAARLGLLPL